MRDESLVRPLSIKLTDLSRWRMTYHSLSKAQDLLALTFALVPRGESEADPRKRNYTLFLNKHPGSSSLHFDFRTQNSELTFDRDGEMVSIRIPNEQHTLSLVQFRRGKVRLNDEELARELLIEAYIFMGLRTPFGDNADQLLDLLTEIEQLLGPEVTVSISARRREAAHVR